MCTNVHHTKMGPLLEARGRCQPEPCSFAPSHSLLLNDPQWEALKSRKERNIASGQQANHFPPCSPPPTHTSFSKTSPRDPLPSGFSFSQTAVVGSHGREAAWSPPGGNDSTAGVQGTHVSPSLSVWPNRFSAQSCLSPAQTFAGYSRIPWQAHCGICVAACHSLYFSLHPELTPHSCSPS